jgi:hypothetical protein
MRSPSEKAIGESLSFEYCWGLLEASGIYHDQLPIANIIADCRLPIGDWLYRFAPNKPPTCHG